MSRQYRMFRAPITRITPEELTFMQQSEGWVERAFSLSEEEQLAVHCQDFNVFMAAGRMQKCCCDALGGKDPPQSKIHRTGLNTHHLTILTGSFLGMMLFSHDSMSGNCSTSWFLIPLITDVFSWIQLDTFSFSSNLKEDTKMGSVSMTKFRRGTL